MDVFGRTIHEMFYSVTTRGINHITLAQFDDICNSKKYSFDLKQEEKAKLMRSIVKYVYFNFLVVRFASKRAYRV